MMSSAMTIPITTPADESSVVPPGLFTIVAIVLLGLNLLMIKRPCTCRDGICAQILHFLQNASVGDFTLYYLISVRLGQVVTSTLLP
jgi:hypothetical protein